MDKILTTCGVIIIVVGIIFLSLFSIGMHQINDYEPETKKVSCYDNHNNRIDDAVCTEDGFGKDFNDHALFTFLSMLLGCAFTVVGIMMMIAGIKDE